MWKCLERISKQAEISKESWFAEISSLKLCCPCPPKALLSRPASLKVALVGLLMGGRS